LSEIVRSFGWQPHSARAVISGLRKAGHAIETVTVEGGGSAYKLTATKELAPTATGSAVGAAP